MLWAWTAAWLCKLFRRISKHKGLTSSIRLGHKSGAPTWVTTLLVTLNLDTETSDSLIRTIPLTFVSVLSASWPATPHSHQDYHHINHIVMDTWRQWRELHPRWERHSGKPTCTGTANEFEAAYSTVLWQVNWTHIHAQICFNYIHYPLNKKDHLPSAPHENQCHLLLYSGLFAIISHYLVFRLNTQVLTGRLKSSRKD